MGDTTTVPFGDTMQQTLARLRSQYASGGLTGAAPTSPPTPVQVASAPAGVPAGTPAPGFDANNQPLPAGWMTSPASAAAMPAPAPGDPGVNVAKESGGRQFDASGNPLIPPQFKGTPDQWNAPVGQSQVRPSTAFQYYPNVDFLRLQNDPTYNLEVGNAVHGSLMRRYNGNLMLADAAYYDGQAAVDQLIQQYGMPGKNGMTDAEFAQHLPPKTFAYAVGHGAVHFTGNGLPGQGGGDPSSITLPYPVENIFKEMQQSQFGAQQEADKELADIRTAMDKMAASAPPTYQQTPPMQSWGSVAMAIAAIGGLLTHTPATTALNAAAGVLNAYNQGDQFRAKQEFDRWKASNDALGKVMQYRISLYNEAMRKWQSAPAQAKAELEANAAALGDQAMMERIKAGDWNGAMIIGQSGVQAYTSWQIETMKARQAMEDRARSFELVDNLQKARATGDPDQIAAAEQALRDFKSATTSGAASVNILTPSATQQASVDNQTLANQRIADQEKALGRPLTEPEKAQIRRDVVNAQKTATTAATAAGRQAGGQGADVQALAAQKIADQEAQLGRPLTDAEKAQIRLDVANQQAGAKAAATTAGRESAQAPTASRQEAADVQAIANQKIADREAELGHPLTDAEKAQIRRDVVTGEKGATAAATAAGRQSVGPQVGSQNWVRASLAADIKKAFPNWSEGEVAAAAEKKLKETQQSVGEVSDAGARLIAERLLAGDDRATIGMARSATNIAKVDNVLAEVAQDRGMSGADIAAAIAHFHGFVSAERSVANRAAIIDLAATEAEKFAPQVLATSAAIPRSSYPSLNGVYLAAQQGTGGEAVVRFVDAVNAYKNAYAQVVTRGNQSTDDARHRADEVMSTHWSQGQVQAGLDQLQKEMQIAREAPDATEMDLRRRFVEMAGGGGQPAATATAPAAARPAPATYPTDDAVKQAYHDGQLTQDQAAQILRDRFGYK